jgi:hypothetical protein
MKKILPVIILACIATSIMAQPGKYAGKQSGLINTVYTDNRHIPGLSDWSFMEGSMLNALSDTMTILVDIYKKGSTFIVFFSTKDSGAVEYTINDVLEIPPLAKGWMVKTSFCRQNETEDPFVVALVKLTRTEYLKTIKKAWRFNRETKMLEQVPVTGISCLNEGFDLTNDKNKFHEKRHLVVAALPAGTGTK